MIYYNAAARYDVVGQMVGVTLVSATPAEKGSEELVFTAKDGTTYRFLHYPQCCETVEIEDVCGDLEDLLGVPLLRAEAVENEGGGEHGGSETWTFYKFSTIKGDVTVRWLGTSNGYYSESVDLEIIPPAGTLTSQ